MRKLIGRPARSLRVRLTLQLLAVASVALAAVTVIGTQVASRAQEHAVYDATGQMIAKQAAEFNAQAQVHQSLAHDLAAVALEGRGDSRKRISDIVGQMAREHPEVLSTFVGFEPNAFDGRDTVYRNRGIYDATGRFGVYWNRIGAPLNLSSITAPGDGWNSPWYVIPKMRRTDVVMEPYLDTGVMQTTYIAPIMDGSRFLGIAGDDVALTELDREVRQVKVLASGYAFVISRTGLLVSFPKHQWLGTKRLADLGHGAQAAALARVTRELAAGRSGHIAAADPLTGRPVELFYAPVATGGWGFVAVAPTAEIMAESYRLRTALLLCGLATLLALGVALMVGAARLARPVTDLVGRLRSLDEHDIADVERGLTAVSQGDLTHELTPQTTPAAVTRRDEIGTLASTFNGMLAKIRRSIESYEKMRTSLARMIGEVAHSAALVSAASEQMASASDQAGRAATEIADGATDVAQGAERQVEMVQSTSETVNSTASVAATSAESAEETAAEADKARALADGGVVAAHAASEAIQQLDRSSQQITAAIEDLAERSERISGIVMTITEIAEQTNLLALNAAIEAARAGDQGRGFAVVADEVRRLADQSHSAAVEIAELIEDIRRRTHDVVEVVAAGAARTADGVATVQRAREAFDQIGRSVEAMSARARENAGALGQIAAEADRIQAGVAEVASVAEGSAASAQEVSAAAQQTSASTREIATTAHGLAGTAEELDRLVRRFELDS